MSCERHVVEIGMAEPEQIKWRRYLRSPHLAWMFASGKANDDEEADHEPLSRPDYRSGRSLFRGM